jgi:hypothetical protein
MTTSALEPAQQWAQNEFGFADVGEPRLNKRLVKIATNLAANPAGTLPQAFTDWAELKAAYRFFDNPKVDYAKVVQPHLERTQKACREPGEYLIIEDSTILDYTRHRKTRDLGVVGDGNQRGFELHSALAMRVEGWTLEQRPEGQLIGLFNQQCRRPALAPEGENRWQRLKRPRRSTWWAETFKSVVPGRSDSQWIYLADRESDFYEPIQTCQNSGVDFIIRAYQDRRLADGSGKLRASLTTAAMLGHSTVELRSRGGEPARTAIVELRSVRVDLDGPWRPGGWQEPLRGVTVVEVREVSTPQDIKEPLHWILLTSLPCQTLVQARRVVGRYTARWLVEEYHKALKSGAGVEKSQLEQAGRLAALVAVLAVVAVRLLNTKLLARSRPVGKEANECFGLEALTLLENKFGKPQEGWNNRTVLVATARLGGFPARKHDGLPGWQIIWRGWQRLMWMSEGLEIMNAGGKTCG